MSQNPETTIRKMSIAEIIDRMNAEADESLALRRQMAGVHVHGIWRGLPNPHTVESFRKS